MTELQNNRWLAADNDFATRIEINDISGIFHKNLTIEPGTRALILERGESIGEVKPGQYTLQGLTDKLKFWTKKSITANGRGYWNEMNRQLMDDYASWLDGEGYEYATEYLELTTLKQIIKFLIENDHLPAAVAFKYQLEKPGDGDTYCWRPQEVQAIIEHCSTSELSWLKQLIIALAGTGLRISELASLRWSDVDLEKGWITLTDETTQKNRDGREKRTTKSGHSRAFPIQDSLKTVLTELTQCADGLVFHGPLGGKIKADTVRRILIRDVLTPLAPKFTARPGEIGFIKGRLHSFRHFFCSICANQGVKERVLMQWLGHRSSKMIHRYYHLHDEESMRQMKQVKLY